MSTASSLTVERAAKPGFRQTSLGIFPEDWDVVALQDVCERVTTGKLDANAMDPRGRYRFYTCARGYYYIDEYAFDDEALLISGNGANVGYIHYYKGKFNAYQRTYVLTGFGADIHFLKCLLEKYLSKRIETEVKAGNTPYITMGTLTEMKLCIPPLPEQRAIAEALGDVDALIAAQEKLIAKKRAIKTATMQRLLTGKQRLPGFGEGCGYKQTEIGVIPEDWENQRIGEFSDTFSGGTPSTSVEAFYNGHIPWITSSDLNKVRITEVDGRISALGLKSSSAKMTDSGTLLMALYGATAGVVAISEIEGAINQAVLAIVPSGVCTHFLFYVLSLRKDRLVRTLTQGGQPNLSGQMVRSIVVGLPPLDEQKAIGEILEDLDFEIISLEKRLAKTRAIKQGMMQELLTGRTRLV